MADRPTPAELADRGTIVQREVQKQLLKDLEENGYEIVVRKDAVGQLRAALAVLDPL